MRVRVEMGYLGEDVLPALRRDMAVINKLDWISVEAIQAIGAVMAPPAKLEIDEWTDVRLPLGHKNLNVVKGLSTVPCGTTRVRLVLSVEGEEWVSEPAEETPQPAEVPDAAEQLG